jgi:hypothetical protein
MAVAIGQITKRGSSIREECDRLVHLQPLRLQDLKEPSPWFGVVARHQPESGSGSISGGACAHNHLT